MYKIDISAYDPSLNLEPFDFSKLSAINTCPTYGVLRYGLHKVWSKGGRATALEAGKAAHEVFAAARLWQLYHLQGLKEHALHHGLRIFGDVAWEQLKPLLTVNDNEHGNYLRFCLEALYTSGYTDDPSDSKRTLTNLEQSCIAYLDRINTKHAVWVDDPRTPASQVGVEQPFDLLVSVSKDSGQQAFRFIGRIDGIHMHDKTPFVHENKTASRLNAAWRESFKMSHQVTGYMLAASFMSGMSIRDGVVHGLSIPLPKSFDSGGFVSEYVKRNDQQVLQWADWVFHTLSVYREYQNDPVHAPKYTHSCNRYFRPCSFIPYCQGTLEDKDEIMEFLEEDVWSPLDEKAGD